MTSADSRENEIATLKDDMIVSQQNEIAELRKKLDEEENDDESSSMKCRDYIKRSREQHQQHQQQHQQQQQQQRQDGQVVAGFGSDGTTVDAIASIESSGSGSGREPFTADDANAGVEKAGPSAKKRKSNLTGTFPSTAPTTSSASIPSSKPKLPNPPKPDTSLLFSSIQPQPPPSSQSSQNVQSSQSSPSAQQQWGKSKWMEWRVAEESGRRKRNLDDDFDYEKYFEQYHALTMWVAPDQIDICFSIASPSSPTDSATESKEDVDESKEAGKDCRKMTLDKMKVFSLSKNGKDTFVSVVNAYCTEYRIHRDHYHWLDYSKDINSTSLVVVDANKEKDSLQSSAATSPLSILTIRAPNDKDTSQSLLREKDFPCFSRFWSPHCPDGWASETEYVRHIVGVPKKSPPGNPPNPTELGDECPERPVVVIRGASHEWKGTVNADDPLSVAVVSFCENVPEGCTPIDPMDVYLQDDEGLIVDAQEETARGLFYDGEPIVLYALYRDEERLVEEMRQKFPVPDGYTELVGSGYLLYSEFERPWLLRETNGIDIYNETVHACSVYRGSDYDGPRYDPIESWFQMMKNLKKHFTKISNKPKKRSNSNHRDWDEEESASMNAVEALTATLLALATDQSWSEDAREKLHCWNPDCRKESLSLLRKMDLGAKKIIIAARKTMVGMMGEVNVTTPDETRGGNSDGIEFGVRQGLDQLYRIMEKYQVEFKGLAECYKPFQKALTL